MLYNLYLSIPFRVEFLLVRREVPGKIGFVAVAFWRLALCYRLLIFISFCAICNLPITTCKVGIHFPAVSNSSLSFGALMLLDVATGERW
jgi:hypothetical protein